VGGEAVEWTGKVVETRGKRNAKGGKDELTCKLANSTNVSTAFT